MLEHEESDGIVLECENVHVSFEISEPCDESQNELDMSVISDLTNSNETIIENRTVTTCSYNDSSVENVNYEIKRLKEIYNDI